MDITSTKNHVARKREQLRIGSGSHRLKRRSAKLRIGTDPLGARRRTTTERRIKRAANLLRVAHEHLTGNRAANRRDEGDRIPDLNTALDPRMPID